MEQSARRRLLNTVFEIKDVKQRSSLSPSGSSKSLRLRMDTLGSEQSINSSISNTPRTALRQDLESSKPISLVIIEKYFSDVCQSIANKGSIDQSLLSKASTMQDVLKDCLTVIHDLSLQFYVLMASVLKEIQQIDLTQDQSLYSTLAKKLLQLADLIEENKYISQTERAITLPTEEVCEVTGLHNISKELFIRMNRVTARVLNIWKKILNPQREAAVISCAFLLLYCEVDNSLKISPCSRIPIDKAIVAMRNYLANPGHVVTIVRKTKEYVDKEMISVETFQRIHDLLSKVTVEQVKSVDKTLTGLAIYELIVFAVKYFEVYAQEHYKLNVFAIENNGDGNRKPGILNEVLADRGGRTLRMSEPKSPITPIIKKEKFVPGRKSIEISKKKIGNPGLKSRNMEPCSTQKIIKPHSASPTKKKLLNSTSRGSSPFQGSGIKIEDPTIKVIQKPLDKSLLVAKQIITTTPKSSSNRTTPVRTRKNNEPDNNRARDVLEEMQYQQFIEEKFRHFLVDKLKKESENFRGLEKSEIKIAVEVHAVKNKESWIEEFEKIAGVIRFNAAQKLSENKRYTAELIRAQRQLDILERFQ